MRTEETIAINEKLEIVKLTNQRFKAPGGHYRPTGYAFRHPELGYPSFDGELPYRPKGGKAVLQETLDLGGFVNFNGVSWVKEI
nr:3-isopropylmalate dehydratase [Aneurinibacillus sp. XH2]